MDQNINNTKTFKQTLGEFGENIGQKFLIKNGYEIIQTNFRTQVGEIDIIAKDDGILVFVEVKTRTNKNFSAIESITKKKQLTMVKVANIFVAENHPIFDEKEMRFDLILIDGNKINLLKNAFIV
jgi:putative endonuclease